MSHEAFPIANYEMGLFLAREPFIAPENAWTELLDCRIFRGRVIKRDGFDTFGRLMDPTVPYTDTATQVVPGGPILIGNEFYDGVTAVDGVLVGWDSQTAVFTYPDAGGPPLLAEFEPHTDFISQTRIVAQGTSIEVGRFIAETSRLELIWGNHPDFSGTAGNSSTVSSVDSIVTSGEPVVGVSNLQLTGAEYLVACNTTSLYQWSDSNKRFELGDQVAPFTGTKEDLFWFWPFDDRLMMTNFVDPVYQFRPADTPATQPVAWTGTAVTPTRVLMVVRFKNRSILLNVTQGGTWYPRRAVWSSAVDPVDLDALDFADAPAEYGDIRTAGFVGARLFVGFDDGWMELSETGVDTPAFEWLPVTSEYGSAAALTTIEDIDRLVTRTETGMEAIDPNNQYPIDAQIPDLMLTFDREKASYSHAIRHQEQRAFWWSYVPVSGIDESNPDQDLKRILAATYDEQKNLSWSQHRMAFTSFGVWEQQETANWDDFTKPTWQSYGDQTFDDPKSRGGYPLILGGKLTGSVYAMRDSSDAGAPIPFRMRTVHISPFKAQRAHFGWLDVYLSAAPGVSLTIEFFRDDARSPYMTETLLSEDTFPSTPESKVYRRIKVNKTAAFHSFAISGESTAFFAIDALVPWMRPAGRIRRFG